MMILHIHIFFFKKKFLRFHIKCYTSKSFWKEATKKKHTQNINLRVVFIFILCSSLCVFVLSFSSFSHLLFSSSPLFAVKCHLFEFMIWNGAKCLYSFGSLAATRSPINEFDKHSFFCFLAPAHKSTSFNWKWNFGYSFQNEQNHFAVFFLIS